MIAAIILSSVFFGRQTEVAEHIEARNSLSVAVPDAITAPETDGFILSVLSETDTSIYFAESESSPKNVQKRNLQLALESGAIVGASSVPAIYFATKNDILSGTYTYDILAASGKELARLLSADLLDDISDNNYIDTSKNWFDAVITDSLTLFGKNYLLSSSLTDTYKQTYVLAYNPSLCDSEALVSAAKDGTLTLDMLLAYEKAIEIDKSDSFALYASLGGSFASAKENTEIFPLGSLKDALGAVQPFAERYDGTSSIKDGTAAFAVMTLGEVTRLLGEGINVRILPLPKRSAEDSYRCYADIGKTSLVALPQGHSEIDTVSYLLYRLAFLSDGYTHPSYYEMFEKKDKEILKIIKENVTVDLSSLFDYGDIDMLIAKWICGDNERLSLEYYNRKTLYEKAFEIIEKRLAKTADNQN